MTYLVLYFAIILSIWWIYRVGWSDALKQILRVLIPSVLIILLNLKAGRLLFRNPVVGIISFLPTAFFVYRGSQPLVGFIESWIDSQNNDLVTSENVVEAEVISREDA